MRTYVVIFALAFLFTVLVIRSAWGVLLGLIVGALLVFGEWNRPPGGRHRP